MKAPPDQATERRARIGAELHVEHQLRIDAERREQRAERNAARWEERVRLVELRATVARRVLEGELDGELRRLVG